MPTFVEERRWPCLSLSATTSALGRQEIVGNASSGNGPVGKAADEGAGVFSDEGSPTTVLLSRELDRHAGLSRSAQPIDAWNRGFA